MKVTRKSPRTGQVNTMDLDITQDQMDSWTSREKLIQDAFPNLTPSEREFIQTGYTQEDWDTIFPPEEEEDEPNEIHEKCMHCGAYIDDCQCGRFHHG